MITLVHADLFQTKHLAQGKTRGQIMGEHCRVIRDLADGILCYPAFSYEFTRGVEYLSLATPADKSLGPFCEYMRQKLSHRTGDPVFSVSCHHDLGLSSKSEMIAFGEGTIFPVVDCIMLYGVPLASLTLIHYVELLAGPPPYRYDKMFHGLADGKLVKYCYHVRPLNKYLEYDWPRLEWDLVTARLLDIDKAVQILDARELVCYWREKLFRDPLYFLDARSKLWVQPILDKLGRRFRQEDFE